MAKKKCQEVKSVKTAIAPIRGVDHDYKNHYKFKGSGAFWSDLLFFFLLVPVG